jgi:hypothetical protein
VTKVFLLLFLQKKKTFLACGWYTALRPQTLMSESAARALPSLPARRAAAQSLQLK